MQELFKDNQGRRKQISMWKARQENKRKRAVCTENKLFELEITDGNAYYERTYGREKRNKKGSLF
jgi:hypothetical protein